MSEVKFADVPGLPGYKVGSNATVWSRRLPGRKHNSEPRLGSKYRKLKLKRQGKYLMVALCVDGQYRTFAIQHLMLLAFVGPRPSPKHGACHKNDIKDDNQLENLYWGTQQRNMEDAARNGLTTKGERNARAKLTEEQVKEILRLRTEEGVGSRRLARMFGVASDTVQCILSGITWQHLQRPTDKGINPRAGSLNGSAKLTKEQALEAVRLYNETGLSQQKIANQFGVGQGAISKILQGKTWSEATGISPRL